MKSVLILISPLLACFIALASSEPVQYCKSGSSPTELHRIARHEGHEDDSAGYPGEVDFCVGAATYRNASTNAHDLFLTLTVRRPHGSPLGWTAVGPGEVMQGALVFVIYGDPKSHGPPVVSIRSPPGHHQPELLSASRLPPGMDVQVLSAVWHPDGEDSIAEATIACYACDAWAGTDISAQSTSQPWIWAWHPRQKFDSFAPDARLQMHTHHWGSGGFGNFYLDMSRSVEAVQASPSPPTIWPGVAALGASETPMTLTGRVNTFVFGPGAFSHGLAMAAAFLVLFPSGVLAMRSGSPKSFKYHWLLQVSASGLLLFGVFLGLRKLHEVHTVHQWVGLALAASVGLQGLLGWWHHVRFVRLRRRTWVSHAHMWLGRIVMVMGWGNVTSGLLLRGYKAGSGPVVTAIVVACVEAVGLAGWVYWVQRRRVKYTAKPEWGNVELEEDAFALGESDDEDEDDVKDETARLHREPKA